MLMDILSMYVLMHITWVQSRPVSVTSSLDDPECDTNPCTELNYQCVETPGSYMCVCADGFIPEDGGTGRCIGK